MYSLAIRYPEELDIDINMAKTLLWLMTTSVSSTLFLKSTSTLAISKAVAYTTPGDMTWREAVGLCFSRQVNLRTGTGRNQAWCR